MRGQLDEGLTDDTQTLEPPVCQYYRHLTGDAESGLPAFLADWNLALIVHTTL